MQGMRGGTLIEPILIGITGTDKPDITASITHTLDQYGTLGGYGKNAWIYNRHRLSWIQLLWQVPSRKTRHRFCIRQRSGNRERTRDQVCL